MKRSANIETLIETLKKGKDEYSPSTLACVVGIPYIIAKPFLKELTETSLMQITKDKKIVTTQNGSEYLRQIDLLNKKFGVDNAIKVLSESKEKYQESKKSRIS